MASNICPALAVGEYSHYPEAILLKKLVRAIPGFVDYALTCTEVEAAALRTTFVGLCRIAMVRGSAGFLAPLCVQEDHGPMLYWLMLADKYDRQLLRVFLEQVELETLKSAEEQSKFSQRRGEAAGEAGGQRRGDAAGVAGAAYSFPSTPHSPSAAGRDRAAAPEAAGAFKSRRSQTMGNLPFGTLMFERLDDALDRVGHFVGHLGGGRRVPGTREEGLAEAGEFNDSGFRIFKSSALAGNVDMKGASRRFEHGVGFMDFDSQDGGVAQDTDKDGIRGGALDSFPMGFGGK